MKAIAGPSWPTTGRPVHKGSSSSRTLVVMTNEILTQPDDQPITARLAGAGSMRAELAAVLDAASGEPSAEEFRRLIFDENAARKRSGTARMWAWKRLKLRYALDQISTTEFRAFLMAYRTATSNADRGLVVGLMLARTDRLFRDITLKRISPQLSGDPRPIDPATVAADVHVIREVSGLVWSDESMRSVVNHLISSWRDVGLIASGRGVEPMRVAPGPSATSFATALGKAEGLTDRAVLKSRWLQFLGADETQSVELVRSAAAAGFLSFRMQADVVEIRIADMARGTG